MLRLFLFVLIAGAIALALTNPTTDDVRAQVNAQVASQTAAGVAQPVVGEQPGMPQAVTAAVSDKLQSQIQIARTNYYLFSIFKVSVGGEGTGGQQLPGCLIGVAKQAIPYDKC